MLRYKTNETGPQVGKILYRTKRLASENLVKEIIHQITQNLKQQILTQTRTRNIYWTWNAQTLRSEDRVVQLEEELKHVHWDIIGLSKLKRKGEGQLSLKSGNIHKEEN